MPNAPALAPRYYPRISNILSSDDIPDSLGFLKAAIQNLLTSIHYKDFSYKKSAKGDAGHYKITIVSKKIQFELFNSGISFILSPDDAANPNSYISAFPVELTYHWKILSYLRGFNTQQFNFSLQDFFELGLQVFNISEEQAVGGFINAFTVPATNSISPQQQFINDLTAFNQAPVINATSFNVDNETTANELIQAIHQQTGNHASLLAFGTYLLQHGQSETQKKLRAFFRIFIPNDVESYIRDIVLPKARATFAVSAAIEFPRNILRPVYPAGSTTGTPYTLIPEGPNGTPKVLLNFGEIEFYADTQQGLGYNAEIALSTSVPAMIGQTGLIIDIQKLKLDLSETRNIPEATADGRPATFRGVYLDQATVIFPDHWTADPMNAVITAKKLLIGNEGGVSGIFQIAGQNIEGYAPFKIGGLPAITVDTVLGTVTVTDANATDTKTFPYQPGQNLFIRDQDKKYYQVSDTGQKSQLSQLPPGGLLKFDFANNMHIELDSFYLELHRNQVVRSSVVGTLSGLPLKAPIRITLEFDRGLIIKADVPSGTSIYDNGSVEIKLDGLEFGKKDDGWLFGMAGRVDIKKQVPVVSKLLPSYFQFEKLKYSQAKGFEFKLEAGWKNGTVIKGDDKGGVSGYVPINLSAENSGLLLKGISLKAKATPNAEIEALLVGAGLKIGPVAATVDGFGAKLVLRDEPEATADFGGTKTEISLVGPKGILVDIKTKVLTGAGYLLLNEDEYIGALSLQLKVKKLDIGITALGIITTKMPDGGSGTAVLALISVTFTPGLPLFWGFQLQGLGGLVGIHHTINTTALREGAKNGTLDSILFPVINIKDTHKIVNDLKTVFPVKRDQFLIGLMARIVWPASAPRVFIDFGLMVEFSNPVRFAIIGKLAVRQGEADNTQSSSSQGKKLVKINAAFIGIIDFDEKYMSFDASIYDSQIGTITLSGDMAMRLFWGEHKEFLLSVGGFHPAYDVPAYLKLPAKMNRVTISLINKKIGSVELRMILELYLAITTNTLQFGAKLDIFIKFWKLEIIGLFGFDVLFQFKPFRFISKVYAMLAVLFKGNEILSIGMDINLIGPGPWHADGKATFKVLGLKKTCSFEKTWGDQPQLPAEPPMQLGPVLLQDLGKDENWVSQMPESAASRVKLKEQRSPGIVVDPLGELSVTQRTVPLGVQLEKFGEKQISDKGKFDIREVVLNENDPLATVYNATQNKSLFGESREDFAPTQFKNMNDTEKLRAKSFEYLRSGVKISSGELHAAAYIGRETTYDVVIVDDEYVDRTRRRKPFLRGFVNAFVKGGAVSANAISIEKNLDQGTPLVLEVTQERYAVAASDTLKPLQSGSATLSAPSYAEALDMQQKLPFNKLTELVYA